MVAVVFAAWKAREARMKAQREAARAAEELEKDKDESSTPKPDAAVPEKQEEELGGAPDLHLQSMTTEQEVRGKRGVRRKTKAIQRTRKSTRCQPQLPPSVQRERSNSRQ